MAYEGMIAETISIRGNNNEPISAYVARPLGAGRFPGMVLLHHAPGWDEWYREATRRFAHHGYAAISHNLYHRAGEGRPRGDGRTQSAAQLPRVPTQSVPAGTAFRTNYPTGQVGWEHLLVLATVSSSWQRLGTLPGRGNRC